MAILDKHKILERNATLLADLQLSGSDHRWAGSDRAAFLSREHDRKSGRGAALFAA